MRVTEVTVRPANGDQNRVVAYCSLVLDGCFVVRDVRVLRGDDAPLIAMPNRPVTDRCLNCHHKTPYLDNYCGRCGDKLPCRRNVPVHVGYNGSLLMDVCYPVTTALRDTFRVAILTAVLSGGITVSGGAYVHAS